MPLPPLQQLTERIADWRTSAIEVDRTNRRVANIALAGRASRNGYEYTPEALRGAVVLYEHKPVFLDHAVRVTKPYDRSTRDLVGSISNARLQDNRIFGDIDVLDTEAGRTFLALAEADKTPVGMSHVVLARRSSDRSKVESIEEVVSVDAVMYPATTRTFRESFRNEDQPPLTGSVEALAEQLQAQLVDFLESQPERTLAYRGLFPGHVVLTETDSTTAPLLLALEWKCEQDLPVLGDELRSLTEQELAQFSWQQNRATDTETVLRERDELLTEVAALEKQLEAIQEQTERAELRNRLLRESRLPEYALTDEFRRQIRSAPDEATCRSLIADRLSLLRHSEKTVPRSSPRSPTDHNNVTDRQLVAAIRKTQGGVSSR